jgi:sodium/bile acid cotransporter 7
VLLNLLLPFVVGQLLQPVAGAWVRAHRPLTLVVDRGTILLVVLAGVSQETADGAWSALTAGALLALVGLSAALLAVVLVLNWAGGARLRLGLPDRIALLMCGSKKSLTTGLPMAGVLFAPAAAATVTVPVIVFHQIQLVVCAVVARRLALRPH